VSCVNPDHESLAYITRDIHVDFTWLMVSPIAETRRGGSPPR
jgi:hypothetical protein